MTRSLSFGHVEFKMLMGFTGLELGEKKPGLEQGV